MTSHVRFFIGEPEHRSSVWKVWSRREDIYLQSRLMGGDIKVSLHRSGECHFSHGSQWVSRGGRRNSERHVARWQMPTHSNPLVAALVFRLIFPTEELKRDVVPDPSLRAVPIRASGPGLATFVELYLSPPLTEPAPLSVVPDFPVGVLPLPNDRCVMLSAHAMPMTPKASAELAFIRTALHGRLSQYADARGWGLLTWPQAPRLHAVIEFDPNRTVAP